MGDLIMIGEIRDMQAIEERYRLAYNNLDLQSLTKAQKEELINKRVTLHTPAEIENYFSEHPEHMAALAAQVSAEIELFEAQNPKQMLLKTPEEILANFRNGNSVIIFSEVDGFPVMLYHGAMYDLLEGSQVPFVGMQLVEMGSDIANSNFRGHGLGKIGVAERIRLLGERRISTTGIATVKKRRTEVVYQHGSGDVASRVLWEQFPYAAYLTDTCSKVRPQESITGYCPLRRNISDMAIENGADDIPCTLISVNPADLEVFEQLVSSLHSRLVVGGHLPEGSTVTSGRVDSLSRESFEKIAAFFEFISDPANISLLEI